jgi:hypothetical protein
MHEAFIAAVAHLMFFLKKWDENLRNLKEVRTHTNISWDRLGIVGLRDKKNTITYTPIIKKKKGAATPQRRQPQVEIGSPSIEMEMKRPKHNHGDKFV